MIVSFQGCYWLDGLSRNLTISKSAPQADAPVLLTHNKKNFFHRQTDNASYPYTLRSRKLQTCNLFSQDTRPQKVRHKKPSEEQRSDKGASITENISGGRSEHSHASPSTPRLHPQEGYRQHKANEFAKKPESQNDEDHYSESKQDTAGQRSKKRGTIRVCRQYATVLK